MKNKILPLLIIIIFLTACSNTRYLPDGELLYTGAKVKIDSKTIPKKEKKLLKSQLSKLIRPKPNKKLLGLRPKLYLYNLVGKVKKEKGLRYWLKNKVGEPPVLYSKFDLDYNKKVLQNFAENIGYFNCKIAADSTKKAKKVSVSFVVNPKEQYKIRSIRFPEDTTAVATAIKETQVKSLLKVGNPYNLYLIKEERNRIDVRLKEKGFYYFNADYLKIQVDSTVAKHEVDLILKLKDETPNLATIPYKINRIIIYPNYALTDDNAFQDKDSIVRYKDFLIIDKEKLFKPRIFDRTLYFKKGDFYNRTNHNLSLNRLVNLGVFKFVKNQFRAADTTGNYLDAYYYLTPLKRKSFRTEIGVKTNSANYTGTELNINWSNRNTFRSAELLTISAFGGFEVQISGQNNGFNVYRAGSEANLIWPRIISPFKFTSSSGFVPRTKATLGYEYQFRSKLYSLKTLKASFGYLWKENERKEHQLNVTEITFSSPNNVSDLYRQQILANPTLEKVIERQLIFGPTYSYTYTNSMLLKKRNTIYNKISLDLSGNLTGLLAGSNVKKGDTTKVFGIPFSQFVKIENDFRHFYKFSENAQLVSRVIVGAGFAYGNSNEMPFIKQFFIGGTNSIRAFRARSLGPGTYDGSKDTAAFLPDQSGDFKLEFNTEYRAKIYGMLNGALFIDAGNIWLLNENSEKPGAQLSKDFLKEIAIGTGFGLRFDFSFLILRTDLAFPIRKPYLPDGDRWVLDKISLGSGAWRRENLVFNLAIGYPF